MNEKTFVGILDAIIWIFIGVNICLAVYSVINTGMPIPEPFTQWLMLACWVWICAEGPIKRMKERANERD